jgi:type VI secretion system protein ImpM
MPVSTVSGLYGKLPGYGDFIFRNLKTSFINPWDEWIQNFISVSREQIGEGWLDIYLTSPIWRFVLSPGVIDNNVYAGVMMPSVDRVGRYFPITVVNIFPSSVNPVEIILEKNKWYSSMEEECLSALNGDIDADELVANISSLQIDVETNYKQATNVGGPGPMAFQLGNCESSHIQKLLPYMLNASLSVGTSSFSIWMTNGSQYIPPILFSSQGLPPLSGATSMLDGRWQDRNWKMPYTLELI